MKRIMLVVMCAVFCFVHLTAVVGEDTCSVSSSNCLDSLQFDLLKSIRWGCPEDYHHTKCANMRIEQIQEWLSKNSKYRILVTGKTGSGKTTFIRGLTKGFIPDTDSLLPRTTEVTPYEFYHEGSDCIFFDTPGLKDNEYSNDYEYIKEMVRKNGEPNLLVFAIRMDDAFDEWDRECIANITSAFGWKIWQRAAIILTYANRVQVPGHAPNSVENRLNFNKVVRQLQYVIMNTLLENDVAKEVIDDIGFIPVGVVSQLHLPGERQDESWVDIFWEEAFRVFKTTRGAAAN